MAKDFDRQHPLTASEAAAQLFELQDLVAQQPGTAVYITRDDHTGSAVLVDAAHYQLLLAKATVAVQLGRSAKHGPQE